MGQKQAWLAGIKAIATQVAVRHLLPSRHSTAAVDTALGQVRDVLDSRSFVLRNKRRTNLALSLIRLHLNGQDLEREYNTLLRTRASSKTKMRSTGATP